MSQTTPRTVIESVYRGPLEAFVTRRDAVAKQLKSDGDKEAAAVIKALRKPSRTAWALNIAAQAEKELMATLTRAVTAVGDAQASGGDLRAAMTDLRKAAREFGDHAEAVARDAGHSVDVGALSQAVLAVLSSQQHMADLRNGTLADVPEAGSLDFLSSLSSPGVSAAASTASRGKRKESVTSAGQPDAFTAAREAKLRAAVAEAGKRADLARSDLHNAHTVVAEAKARLLQAEAEVVKARAELDRVELVATSAADRVASAERAAADAEKDLQQMHRP